MVHVSSEWTPNVALSYLVRCSLLVFLKELLIDVEVPLRNESQLKFFEHIDENVSIDELNWWYSIPSGFLLGFESESAGSNNQTLSARPIMAPRKSRTWDGLTTPWYHLHWNNTLKLTNGLT